MKHKSNLGFGNNRSGFGKTGSKEREEKMHSVALTDAIEWTNKLMEQEARGRKAKEYQARFEVSQKTGVSERYLYRLLYQSRTMKDVAGEAYRLLYLAKQKYIEVCETNENAAAAYTAERKTLEAKRHEANRGPAPQGD